MSIEVLAIDPSGSFNEGKGQSGWVKMVDGELRSFGLLKASDYSSRTEFWKAHSNLIEKHSSPNITIVIENYRLYSHKATSQINSEMETVRLLGYLETWIAHKLGLDKLKFQMAAQVKNRFNDNILIRNKLIKKDSNGRYYLNGINVAGHVVDALRHACFFNLTNRKDK